MAWDKNQGIKNDASYLEPRVTQLEEVRVITQRQTVTISADQSSVTIPFETYNKDKDILMVFVNSTYIELSQDFSIDTNGKAITKISGSWESGSVFNFIMFKYISEAGNVVVTDGSQLADDSVMDRKLHPDAKVGSLASLKTNIKTDIVAAINEHDDDFKDIIPVDIKDFGADPTGANDSTQAFRDAIKAAYDLSYNTTGWRSPKKIKIPGGKYLITDTIIDTLLSVSAGRFVFEGDGWQSTEILYEPTDAAKFLFDNDGVFGFTTFSGILFSNPAGTGKFMNGVGGGTGNAQSLIFEKCRFSSWNNIITVTGPSMMSEITFRDCKIAGGSGVIFSLDNEQSVNWRFYGTDIESFSGVLFDFLKGSMIHMYQGSVIPIDGTFARVNSAADVNKFGSTVSPALNLYGVKFELRGMAKLLDLQKAQVIFKAVFNECGLGGWNLDSTSFPLVINGMKKDIVFNNCDAFNNYKIDFTGDNGSSFTDPNQITFVGSSPDPVSFLNNSIVSGVSYNDRGFPDINFIDCGLNTSVKLRSTFMPEIKKISTHALMFGTGVKNALKGSGDGTVTYEKTLPNTLLKGVRFVNIGTSAYGGSVEFKIDVFNQDRTKTLMTGTFNIASATVLTDTLNGIPNKFGLDGKIIIDVTPVSGTSTSTNYYIEGYFELDY